jgi:hypothetical protein
MLMLMLMLMLMRMLMIMLMLIFMLVFMFVCMLAIAVTITITDTVTDTILCELSLLVAMMVTVTIAEPGHFVSIPVAVVFALPRIALEPGWSGFWRAGSEFFFLSLGVGESRFLEANHRGGILGATQVAPIEPETTRNPTLRVRANPIPWSWRQIRLA